MASLIKFLNKLINPNHSWFDYSDAKWGNAGYGKFSSESAATMVEGNTGLSGLINALANRLTGAHLTGSELEANEFSAEEAQKSRDFTEYMTRNKYQMETASMEQAGLNPAMVYGGGQLVPTASNGASASSVSPEAASLFDILPTIARLPAEIDEIRSAAERNRAEGQAVLETAAAQTKNAESNAQNAKSNARIASVRELEVQIHGYMAESNVAVNDERIKNIAQSTLNLQRTFEQMDEYLSVAQQNANSQERSALAALRSASAAMKNAETNEYLSTFQSSLLSAQALYSELQGDKLSLLMPYVQERERNEIDNIIKRGVHLDKSNVLVDKYGHKVDAETVESYVRSANYLSDAANKWYKTLVPNWSMLGGD